MSPAFGGTLPMLVYLIVILVGLAVGSFLNVVIFRVDSLKSVLNTRSHCLECKEIIKWYDLIPLISFIILRGRCRNCNAKISWQYPAVEISTAILYLLLFLTFGLNFAFIFYCLVFSFLIVVFVYDIKTQMIPEEFVWPALILALFGGWYFGHFDLFKLLIGGIIGGGVPLLLVVISKEKWMGAGDIKLGILFGVLLGYPRAILFLFLAFLLGSIVGLILIAGQKKKLKDSLPFAPFLILAGLITLIWGNKILEWYLGYFLLN